MRWFATAISAVFLFVLALVFAPLGAIADTTPQVRVPACGFTPDAVTNYFLHRYPGPRVVNLTGAPAQAFLDAFNDLPPPSSVVGDQVIVFQIPGGVDEVVVFILGCMVAHSGNTAHLIDPLLGQQG